MNYNESDEINSYESKTDKRFVPTIDDPLKFFKSYLKSGGEAYMKSRFESYEELNGEYNKENDKICFQKCLPTGIQRGELLNEETNCYEYDIDFDEYVGVELTRQANISAALIEGKVEPYKYDQDLIPYNNILFECIDIHKDIDANRRLNYKDKLSHIVLVLFNRAFQIIGAYYPKIPGTLRAKGYIDNIEIANVTGFKLKPYIWYSRRRDFYKRLVEQKYITTRDVKSFDEFFQGKKPEVKINWGKKLCELKYFIDRIYDDRILEKKPKQQWIYLGEIFTCEGVELPLNWHRNRNKLKDMEKKEPIDQLTNMLLPEA